MWSTSVYGVALLLIFIGHWVFKWRNPKCNVKLPPGSLGLPLVGETVQFCKPSNSVDMSPFFKTRLAKYGSIFKTSLAGRPVVVSSDADFNYFILQQEGKLVELWYMDSFAELIGQNAELKEVLAVGHAHKQFKKLVAEQFGIERLKGIILPEMEETIIDTLDSWTMQESVEVNRSCSTMILNFGAKLFFSYDPANAEANLSEAFPTLVRGLMSFPLNIPGTTYYKCLQNRAKVLKMIKAEADKRRAYPSKRKGDFLDCLIGDTDDGNLFSDKAVVYILFTLLFAASETIPTTLTLAIKFLTEHPLAMQELVKEHEEIVRSKENKDTGIKWSEYKSMTFTMQVVNECLRMSGSVANLRRTIEDIHINGYTIPKGWTIAVVPSVLHMNPDIYKDPAAFDPWRWEDLGTNIKAKHFIPFGSGMRSCGGADFSRVFMAAFLHLFVTKFRWTKVKGGEIVRTPFLGFGDGFYIKVSKRPKVQAKY